MPKSKHVRAGSKFTSSHTTVIEAAGVIADILERLPQVTKISINVIVPKKGARGGKKRLKISETGSALKLKISEGAVYQIFYVYGELGKIAPSLSAEANTVGFEVTTE